MKKTPEFAWISLELPQVIIDFRNLEEYCWKMHYKEVRKQTALMNKELKKP